MDVRLFPKPHCDEMQPGVCRLLFEAWRKPLTECQDFYLYVWVRDGRRIEGFQAVMDDAFALSGSWNKRPVFGPIGRKPFNRSIAAASQDPRRKQILSIVQCLHSDNFGRLLIEIGRMASGSVCSRELTSDEHLELSLLLSNQDR